MTEAIIGIDLGTTNSLAAMVFEEGPEVIGRAGESPIIPSVLSKTSNGWIVGREALPYRTSAPSQTVYSVKRLMGRDIEELEEEIQELPYQIVAAQRKLVKIRLGDHEYTPQELSAEILKKVKTESESILGYPINKAVITVPAYFDDAQRQATRDAGKIAGLDVVRIINEPTAAAIAYGLDEKKEGYVAVYDLGGGTFDISILRLSGKVFKVVATCGNTHLGGDDFDRALSIVLKEKVKQKYARADLNDPISQQIFKQVAENLKIQLSSSLEADYQIEIPEKSISYQGTFSTGEFDSLIKESLDQTLSSCQQALEDCHLDVSEIDEVVLVGGSTRIPSVRQYVERFFQRKPNVAIDPYKVVAIGAGIQGHLLAGGRRDFVLLDVIPLALGIETLGGTFSKIITQNTTIPTEASELFTTHVDNQTGIEINLFQGERELVKDCRKLGQFKLRGIPPMQAGLPLVEVTLHVDANGILTVSALEKRSGQKASIEVVPFHGLTQYEIEQIMDDSYEHALEDFNERQLIEFRNTVEGVFQGIEKNWSTAENVLSDSQREAIRRQMKVVEEYSKGTDAQSLKEQMDILGDLTRPLADAAIGNAVLSELQKSPASS
ncbi:MAG: Fe-S protein assembly chaperone HscA [SAR324 cluster bacterium]|nr:Fe-S protein assembly chaperone HscA [SAR324 cluster bacterium]